MKITEIRFDASYIYGKDEKGMEYKQSLLWYPKLQAASEEERMKYSIGLGGIHWRNLDEDISFESFEYEDAEPSAMQRFFLTHKEINVAEFARMMGINPTLLRNYINGFKKPSKEREQEIIDYIHKLGKEMIAAWTSDLKLKGIVLLEKNEDFLRLYRNMVQETSYFAVSNNKFN